MLGGVSQGSSREHAWGRGMLRLSDNDMPYNDDHFHKETTNNDFDLLMDPHQCFLMDIHIQCSFGCFDPTYNEFQKNPTCDHFEFHFIFIMQLTFANFPSEQDVEHCRFKNEFEISMGASLTTKYTEGDCGKSML